MPRTRATSATLRGLSGLPSPTCTFRRRRRRSSRETSRRPSSAPVSTRPSQRNSRRGLYPRSSSREALSGGRPDDRGRRRGSRKADRSERTRAEAAANSLALHDPDAGHQRARHPGAVCRHNLLLPYGLGRDRVGRIRGSPELQGPARRHGFLDGHVAQRVPLQLFLVPLFFLWSTLHLTNTRFGLIVIYWAIFSPLATLLMRSYLVGLPRD